MSGILDYYASPITSTIGIVELLTVVAYRLAKLSPYNVPLRIRLVAYRSS